MFWQAYLSGKVHLQLEMATSKARFQLDILSSKLDFQMNGCGAVNYIFSQATFSDLISLCFTLSSAVTSMKAH